MLESAVGRNRYEQLLVSFSEDIFTMKETPEDRRISQRTNRSYTFRIRPIESQYAEEIRTTLNVSWDGLYFATSLGHYFSGMTVYVTGNFRSNDPTNREEQGTVVRVDKLKEGRWGVAVHLGQTLEGKRSPDRTSGLSQ
jgi:hypothetical protein